MLHVLGKTVTRVAGGRWAGDLLIDDLRGTLSNDTECTTYSQSFRALGRTPPKVGRAWPKSGRVGIGQSANLVEILADLVEMGTTLLEVGL